MTQYDNDPWTPDEDAYLTEWYGEKSASVIGQTLGRSRAAVLGRARRIGLGTSTNRATPSLRKF